MLNLPVHEPARPYPLIRWFERYALTVTQRWFATPLFFAMAELSLLEQDRSAATQIVEPLDPP
jgi:hypothetical protein